MGDGFRGGRLRLCGNVASMIFQSFEIAQETRIDRRDLAALNLILKKHPSALSPHSFQHLHIPLLNQTLNIPLPDKKLTIPRQVQTAILRLNLPRVPQDPYIDENIPRRLQTARQIHIRPLALVLRQQLAVLVHVLLLLGGEGGGVRRGGAGWCCSFACWPRGENVLPPPDHLFQFGDARAVVGEQTAFVAPHAEVVDHEAAGGGGIFGRVEGGFDLRAIAGLGVGVAVLGEDFTVFPVQVADFFGYGLGRRAGVGGQVGEVLDAFGGRDEFVGLFAVHFWRFLFFFLFLFLEV